jgi:hypothetical protein
MMRLLYFFLTAIILSNYSNAQFSCNSVRLADVPGQGRYWATACSNSEYALAGGGLADFGGNRLADFYLYNIAENTWMRVDDYPGGAHEGMMSFVINGRFFAGFGTPFITSSKKLYELNTNTGEWIPRADAPFPAAYHQAYVANGKAYILPAYSGNTPNIIEYDPELDSWRVVMQYNSEDVQTYSIGFTINNIIYLGMGYEGFSNSSKRWYKFDPSTETLTRLNDLNVGGAGRQSSAFKINNTGYMYNVSPGRIMIRYNETTDSWVQICNFAQERIANASSFGTTEFGYVVFGQITGSSGNISSNQLWQFEPVDLSSSVEDVLEENIQVYSGGDGELHVNISQPGIYQLDLFDLTGRRLATEKIQSANFAYQFTLKHNELKGIHLLQIKDSNGITVRREKVYL